MDTVEVFQGSAKRISKSSAPEKRRSRSPSSAKATRCSLARGSKGLISWVALPRLRSLFHVPADESVDEKGGRDRPVLRGECLAITHRR